MSSLAVCVDDLKIVREDILGYSSESRRLRAMTKRTAEHLHLPISRQAGLEFFIFSKRWKEGVVFLSSITEACLHPDYQRIIGMGDRVIPFILRELERDPDLWFWALKAITGADPVEEENRGRIKQMAKDWLLWAEDNGYEW